VKLEDKLMAIVLLNILDWYMTLHAIELGATELNPLMARLVEDPVKFSVVKLAIPTTALFAGAIVSPRISSYREVAEVVVNAILILYVVIVTLNAIQLAAYYLLGGEQS